jgi:prepilin-type N-terminal cleavage/methylation domain-containing protein
MLDDRKALSLIELLVALSVLAIIAVIIVPRFIGVRDQATQAVVKADLDEISGEVQKWQALGGTYDTTDLLAAFHLVQFLATPGDGVHLDRGLANGCLDSPGTGGSWTIGIPTSVYVNPVAAGPAAAPTSTSPDGYYATYNATGTKPLAADGVTLAPSPIGLYVKKNNQVYPVSAQNDDLATAVFIRTGDCVTPGQP